MVISTFMRLIYGTVSWYELVSAALVTQRIGILHKGCDRVIQDVLQGILCSA